MALFDDLLGTLQSAFRLGLTGVTIRSQSGQLNVRNTANSADAAVLASTVNLTGDSLVINSDATSTGTDYAFTLSRNSAQSAPVTLVAPPAKGTDGFLIRQKSGTAANVIELEFVAPSGGSTNQVTTDTTSIAFGSTSPITLFTLPANAVIVAVRVYVDTAFNGTPSISVGITGTTSKYVASNQVDLNTAGCYQIRPTVTPSGSTEALIATYSAGGASAGAGRIDVDYVIPS